MTTASPSHREPTTAPLTFAQERLWLHAQLYPASPIYNIANSVRLRGALDLAALRVAFQSVVDRHAALRTGIVVVSDVPVQEVHADVVFELDFVDVSDVTDATPTSVLRDRAGTYGQVAARSPFDLTAPPLLRARVIRLGPDDHVLTTVIHHIVSDMHSCAVLGEDLGAFYRAAVDETPPDLAELATQYPEHARAQQQAISDQTVEQQLEYWRSQLAGMEVLRLPAPPGERPSTDDAETFRVELPASTLARVGELARRERCTDFVVLLSVVQLLLGRYTGQDDITIASPVSDRGNPDLQQVIGLFANTILLRTRLQRDESFRAQLSRTRDTVLDGMSAAAAPVERVATDIGQRRNGSDQSLYQAMFTLQSGGYQFSDFGDCEVEPFVWGTPTTFVDLDINALPVEDRLAVEFNYRLGALAPEVVADLGASFVHLLDQVLDDPDRPVNLLDALAPARREQVLVDWNAQGSAAPDGGTVLDRLADTAAGWRAATAVECGDSAITYAELWERSGQLAGALIDRGVVTEDTVAVHADRGIDFVVALLGVLRAGGACVPVDRSLPRARIDSILDVARPRLLLVADEGALSHRPEQRCIISADGSRVPDASLPQPSPQQLAYVTFTSGTTGSPKGVEVEHRALCNVIDAERAFFGLTPADRQLQLHQSASTRLCRRSSRH